MPTKREREYYRMGFQDGQRFYGKVTVGDDTEMFDTEKVYRDYQFEQMEGRRKAMRGRKKKRKLSAWNKFVKANSKKKIFRYRNGKLNLKKMGVAFRRKRR